MNSKNPVSGQPTKTGEDGKGFNWGAAIPGITQAINSGVTGAMYQDPSKAADQYLNQIGSSSGQYFNPYIDSGRNALDTLSGQYGNLINDPTFMMNQIGAGYQQSPGYQFQVDQAMGASNRAASAGGMLGSPMQQQNIASTVNQLANQDYGQYMDRGLSQYGIGLAGMGGINQMGYNASSSMADAIRQQLMLQSENARRGVEGQNRNTENTAAGVSGGMGAALSGGASGAATGAMFGPWGAAIGGGIGAVKGYFS